MSRQTGSVAPLLLATVAVLLLFMVGVADAGLIIAGRYQAAAAADAAALAAAPVTFRPFGAGGTPAEEAARFAGINGAVMISCHCNRDPGWKARTVEVVVARRVELVGGGTVTVRARSTAEFDPLALLGEVDQYGLVDQ